MKLDKIKFALVVAFIVDAMRTGFDDEAIRTLDSMIDIDVTPIEVPGKADPSEIDALMKAIHADEKIAAIKTYRNLTGMGLKEAKDAVEKYWVSKPEHTLGDILNKATERPPVNFDKFEG